MEGGLTIDSTVAPVSIVQSATFGISWPLADGPLKDTRASKSDLPGGRDIFVSGATVIVGAMLEGVGLLGLRAA